MSSVSGLDATYVALIQDMMEIERQPLTHLTEKKDTITLQKSVMTDLKKLLDELQTSAKAMRSTDVSYTMKSGYSVAITGRADGMEVLAAAASSGAVPGLYNVQVETLAKEHRVRSDRQAYSNQDLGLSGTFRLGGADNRVQTTLATIANTLTGFSVTNPASDQAELGSGSYFVETRQNGATWEFRLVDEEGKAVRAQKGATGEYTTNWQSIPSGSYDSGRGLTIQFGTDPSQYSAAARGSGAAQVNYTAQGALISISPDDSLIDVAYAINHAKYAAGNEVTAAIIDNHLILSGKNSGAGRVIAASDITGNVLTALGITSGGAMKNVMQTPASARFTVNSMTVTRSSNSNLTDVINGVTLNLQNDAAGQAAALAVAYDPGSERTIVEDFLKKFNALQAYLGDKVSTVKNADGTYKRGSLANDSSFAGLRQNLMRTVNTTHTNSGTLRRLTELGLELDSSLKLTIKDANKLQEQLTSNRNNVVALLDTVMSRVEGYLAQFTGTAGYVTRATRSLENQLKDTNTQISRENTRLTTRQEALTMQFAAVQTQLSIMYNQRAVMQAFSTFTTSG